MFLGQFKHTIDSKGRITIPARFRDAFEAGAYVTQGFERNLVVYTTGSFQRLAKRANTLTMTNPEARAMRRVLFGGASEVSIDSNGRILIPSFLREYAELDGETFLVGVGEYFEIWRADAWEHELVDVTDADVNAKRFTDFDISSG